MKNLPQFILVCLLLSATMFTIWKMINDHRFTDDKKPFKYRTTNTGSSYPHTINKIDAIYSNNDTLYTYKSILNEHASCDSIYESLGAQAQMNIRKANDTIAKNEKMKYWGQTYNKKLK